MTWNADYVLSKSPRNSFVGGTKSYFFRNGGLQQILDYHPTSETSSPHGVPIVIPLSINNAADCTTWPKMKKATPAKPEELERMVPRPMTATLERPRILDIAFLGKIDMSLTRKGFISISNLCLSPNRRADSKDIRRVCSSVRDVRPNKARKTRLTKKEIPEEGSSIDTKSSERDNGYTYHNLNEKPKPMHRKSPPVLLQVQREKPSPKHTRQDPLACDEMNNNVSKWHRPVVFRKGTAEKKVDEVFVNPKPIVVDVPEPCTTCGRPEQPERFHSHPTTGGPGRSVSQRLVTSRSIPHSPRGCSESLAQPKSDSTPVVKSSVRKPVPIKFRSGKASRPAVTDSAVATASPEPSEPTPMATSPTPRKDPREKQAPKARPGPRIVMCYLCGREFGTASYPLHEPHCLQRWQRENSMLPTHLQRPVPQKPEKVMSLDEWNQFAWEASQARLVPCENCGRTFNPDRLDVHQRSCRSVSLPVATPGTQALQFGRRAVTAVAAGQGGAAASVFAPPQAQTQPQAPAQAKRPADGGKRELGGGSGCGGGGGGHDHAVGGGGGGGGGGGARLPPTVPCYVCGRMFGSASIGIHEPKCLEKWRAENSRLPAQQRRPDPVKPDAVRTGQFGSHAHAHAHAQAHVLGAATAAAAVAARTPAPAVRHVTAAAAATQQPGQPLYSVAVPLSVFVPTISVSSNASPATPTATLVSALAPAAFSAVPSSAPAPSATNTCVPKGPWRRAVPCYLCGRLFGTASINIHEAQCLKKWRTENSKLPSNKRRQEPEKPCIMYLASGDIDYEGTMNAIWQTHLEQLVPCTSCGRTFYPDRLEVHARACKGPKR